MSDEELLEVIGERTKNRDKIDQCRIALRSVVGCMNSRVQSSTCIEDHHPSCREYLQHVLDRLEEK
jgi:hypothetical protein